MTGSNRLRVGACLSLTGPFAIQGRQARAGVELWAEEVTRAGGIAIPRAGKPRAGKPPAGERVLPRLHILDDRSRREEAARLTERLIRDEGVELLLGPYSSALTLAAAPVAESFEMTLWNHGGSADTLYERGFRFLVGVAPPASTYFRGVLEWARDVGFAGRRVALFHGARGGFPSAVAGGALRWAEELGFEVVYRRAYPTSRSDFARLPAELRGLRLDLLLGAGRFEEDVAFARALHGVFVAPRAVAPRAGVPRAVALVAAGVSAFGEALGGDAEGFLGPSQWEMEGGHSPQLGASSEEFATKIAARTRRPVDYPAAQAYAACLIAARCLELAGSREPARLRDAASSLRCTTLFGPFQIEPATGKPLGLHAPLLVQWQGRKKAIVWSPAQGAVTQAIPFSLAPALPRAEAPGVETPGVETPGMEIPGTEVPGRGAPRG